MQISSERPDRTTLQARPGRARLFDSRAFRGALSKAAVWLILPTVLVGGAVLAGTLSKSQLYEATARVELGQGVGAGAPGEPGRSELQLIRALARRVMAELPLATAPEFRRSNAFDISHLAARFGIYPTYGARKGEAHLVDALADRLALHPTDDGRALAVSFVSEDPRTAERVAERVGQAYVDLRREARQEQLHDAAASIAYEIAAMRRRIVQARQTADPAQARMLGDLEASVESLERKQLALDRPAADARLSGPARAAPLDKQAAQLTTAVYAASATGLAGILAFLVAGCVSLRPPQRRQLSAELPRAAGEAPSYHALCQLGAKVLRGDERRVGGSIETGDARLVEGLAAQLAVRDCDRQGLRILVTASAAKDGGAVSVDLARALAGCGRRAVIVEIDAKRDSLGHGGGQGLSELLASSVSFADVIHRDPRSRVHYIACGEAPLPVGKPFADRLAATMEALALTYDFVIVSGPMVDEAASLARLVDSAILVAGDGVTGGRTVAAYDLLAANGLDDIVVLMSPSGLRAGAARRAA